MARSPNFGPTSGPDLDTVDSDESDLTPTSSPLEASKDVNPSPTRNNASANATNASPASRMKKKPSKKSRFHPGAEKWSLETLGSYVWILIDKNARVFEPQNPRDTLSKFKDGIWWPGKLESSDTSIRPLKIRLFGELFIRGVQPIEIQRPCEMNILSLQDSQGRMRFLIPTFGNDESSHRKSIHSSPRKKQKNDRTNMEQGWQTALAELEKDKEGQEDDDSDGMPEIGSRRYSSFMASDTSLVTDKKGSRPGLKEQQGKKRSRSDSSDSEIEYQVANSKWTPPPADELLKIPGELILALDAKSSRVYWPAKIMAYVPPKSARQEGKYQIKYLDDTVAVVTRSMFLTSDENEFPTCKLGTWESQFKEVENDEENGNDSLSVGDLRTRSPSPQPVQPPPDATTFTQLSIREQFVYTKPILSAVLNERYLPVRAQHDDFISGGSKRKKVVDEAVLRGGMDPRDVTNLQHLLSYWCLRDEIRAEVIKDDENLNGFAATQLSGSEEARNFEVASHEVLPQDGQSASTLDLEQTPPLSQSAIPPSSPCTASQSSLASISDVSGFMNSLSSDDSQSFYKVSPRQRGCDAYESLSRVEKADYCLNVLLPEAILQILLWRTGKRRTSEILSATEEETLHEEGRELLKERDWVYDILRLRESDRRRLKLQGLRSEKNADNEVLYSIRGRPMRSVAAPKSYLE